MRNNAFSLRPRNSLRRRNDATHSARRSMRDHGRAQAQQRSSRQDDHHVRPREFNTRSRTQMVRPNFAGATLSSTSPASRGHWWASSPPVNGPVGPPATTQERSVSASEAPGFRPQQGQREIRRLQRSDYKFILKIAAACESRIRKFQKEVRDGHFRSRGAYVLESKLPNFHLSWQ